LSVRLLTTGNMRNTLYLDSYNGLGPEILRKCMISNEFHSQNSISLLYMGQRNHIL